ncbi:unnamed protein product [Brassica oleracea]
MESDAGSSVARRRRRLSVVALSFVSLPLHVTLWAWVSYARSPSLCAGDAVVAIPDLKLLGCVLPSSSPTTLNFLPSGKIDANWFSCPCGSRTSPPGSLFVRSMRLNGSKYYYQTIQTKFLLFDDPRTNPCSLQTPFEATHTDDCSTFLSLSDHNDQWLDFGSVKSPGLQHGNAGVGCLCLESTPVHSEVCVKPISLSVGIKGRERSFSTSSFSKERFFPPISLCIRGDPLPVFKTRKIYQCPSRLLSCVKVRLGPVDAMILILMRFEVLDGAATSYAIVTNRSLFEDFEEDVPALNLEITNSKHPRPQNGEVLERATQIGLVKPPYHERELER